MAYGWPSWPGTIPTHPVASEIAIVDVATGKLEIVAGTDGCATGGRWLPDGSLLYVSDESGWFQVVRRSPDGRDRHRPDRRRTRARRTGRRVRARPAGLARRHALRPHRGPRRVPGPRRRLDGGRGGAETWPRAAAEVAADRRRRGPWPAHRSVRRRLAGDRLARRRGLDRGDRRERDPAAGPVAAAGPRRGARGCAPAPGHRFAPGRATTRAGARPRRPDGTIRVHRPRRAAGRRHRPSPGRRRRQARQPSRAGHHLPARRPDRADVPAVRAVQAAVGGRGLRRRRRGLPRFDRLRPGVPRGQPRRVGPRRHPRRHRWRPVGRRAALVGRPARHLRRVVRRLRRAVRPGRGARDVVGRRGPLRRFGDRRELPARRSAGPARPAPDDGLTRRRDSGAPRSGAGRRSIARSASRPRCCSSTAGRTSGSSRS